MTLNASLPPDDRPTGSAAEQCAMLVAHVAVNAEYRHLVLQAALPATEAAPGQFFQLHCPAPAGAPPFLRRPMTVYGANLAAGEVAFPYKITSAGTLGLATLATGDTLTIVGPLGRGWRNLHRRVASLLRPFCRRAALNWPCRTPCSEAAGRNVTIVTDAEGTSGPIHVERLLRRLIAEKRCDAFFTCSSARLLAVQQRLAHEFGLPGQVALEQQMACGLGMCFCCVRDFNDGGTVVHKRVCWDGPVFDLMEAMP